MSEKSKIEQIKAFYLELNETEKVNFHKFLEEQKNKEYDELKKMREEMFSQFEKSGSLAKDYLKKLLNI